MLARLAHVIARNRWKVIGVWLVLTLFGGFSAGQVSKRWYQSFTIPGYSAFEASQRTFDHFGTGLRTPDVIVFQSKGDVTKDTAIPAAMARTAEASATLARKIHTPGNTTPRTSSFYSTGSSAYVSKDRHTTFMELYPAGSVQFDTKSG